ncbi:hypothetical protein HMPREF1574_00731 [Gardnerella pickettii JCP7659]|uniref:Uncharacterized protein n=1 Tax=Gardnerella pickettii JCP8017A TaxID=1261062 RepID=T2PNB7_9BIFI|nr:hypothetical protein HMPREF1577_00599 [Gardnerella pickettii JCP8017A]EPI55257.1 hypothetical protein HMPREF1574_00731 [Gardnerella pickettii JCP7659]EPI61965.1 hypothetical protein HMPREF1578_00413 [Gardnerella pickettii JCP8017B]
MSCGKWPYSNVFIVLINGFLRKLMTFFENVHTYGKTPLK